MLSAIMLNVIMLTVVLPFEMTTDILQKGPLIASHHLQITQGPVL
jgi:hypothetical protein